MAKNKMMVKNLCHVDSNVDEKWKIGIREKVCGNFPLLELEGIPYCILHLPDNNKDNDEFNQAFNKLIENTTKELIKVENVTEIEKENLLSKLTFDFRAICFPNRFRFNGQRFTVFTNFNGAKFLGDVLFNGVVFDATISFNSTEFNGDVEFRHTIFSEKSQLYFIQTDFERRIDFYFARFSGYLLFLGLQPREIFVNKSSTFTQKVYSLDKRPQYKFKPNVILDFQHCKVEQPNKIIFNSLNLYPNWFIDINPKEITFTDVWWENINNDFTKSNVKTELRKLEERGIRNSKQLFKITCRQLAENAENNGRFEEASSFRKLAFETERLERKDKINKWWREEFTPLSFLMKSSEMIKKFPYDFAHFSYRWSSAYGESWRWATFVLLLVIFLVFPVIYIQTNFQSCPKEKPLSISLGEKSCTTGGLPFGEAIIHSLTTATLQNVEYRKPTTVWGELWIILEKIFAPLQTALLALAIRRKFMR
ncbi:MAG: pentapeptide repeat-containing protein [Pyrinomonadaceae bacterium]|nr:pentapeptide repeat-containing protein [Pyrinomonadaceae bacterium]